MLREGPGGDGTNPEETAEHPGPQAPEEPPQQNQLRVAGPPNLPPGVGSGFGWQRDGGEDKGGGGHKGKGKGRDAIELVQRRLTGVVRSTGTTNHGIDGFIEIDQADKSLPSRYIHFHSLNWLSASVHYTLEAYQQNRLIGHPVSFLVDSYQNRKGPRGIALGMALIPGWSEDHQQEE